MDTFKVELVFSGEHNVDPEKKNGETVNFGAGGDYSADYIIRRFVLGMRAVLNEYKHTVMQSAVIVRSDEVKDDILTGLRTVEKRKPKEAAPKKPEKPVKTEESATVS